MERFKLDENLPAELANRFAEKGHDAVSVLDQRLGGVTDSALIDVCRREKRTLVTLDLDFADLRTYPPEETHGILVFRLRRQDRSCVMDAVERLLPILGQESLEGKLWIVEETRVRMRGGGEGA